MEDARVDRVRSSTAAGLVVDGARFARNGVRFARALRNAGVSADLSAAIEFTRALLVVDLGDREQVRSAGAAVFVHRHDDLAAYDRVFDRFWRAERRRMRVGDDAEPSEGPDQGDDEPDEARALVDTAANDGPTARGEAGGRPERRERADDAPSGASGIVIGEHAYSPGEIDHRRRFDRMSQAELRDAERFVDRFLPKIERRRTRRSSLEVHGRSIAPRKTLRRSLATGGEVLEWFWRRRLRRRRELVVLCDISGSMERHSRVLLRFTQALATSAARTEAFVFGTRLTRVTRLLRDRDRDRAVAKVSEAVSDWSGGTRIGHALREFNQRWARRILRSGAIVVVVSDGWDRGDPHLVTTEMKRLQRACQRLVWVNPLASAPGYEPLARGMSAALPFVDDFVPGGNLETLESLGIMLIDALHSSGGRTARRGVA